MRRGREGRKRFFFEKKETKNFCSCRVAIGIAAPIRQSFLLLFSKKKRFPSFR
jgi:hypothetical protein